RGPRPPRPGRVSTQAGGEDRPGGPALEAARGAGGRRPTGPGHRPRSGGGNEVDPGRDPDGVEPPRAAGPEDLVRDGIVDPPRRPERRARHGRPVHSRPPQYGEAGSSPDPAGSQAGYAGGVVG